MSVINLTEYAGRDTSELAKWLSENAGRIAGAAITIRMLDGKQRTVFTGIYKRRPSEAASAALQLSMKLASYGDPP